MFEVPEERYLEGLSHRLTMGDLNIVDATIMGATCVMVALLIGVFYYWSRRR